MQHRHLWRIRNDVDALDASKRHADVLRLAHERRHLRQQLVEAALGRERHRLVRRKAAAVADAPDQCLCDHVLGAGEDATAERAEVLVQRHVDRVEERRDLAQRPAVERPALPEPRAVEVQRDAVRARPGGLRAQGTPRRKLPTEIALRQLEEQRAKRFVDALQIRALDQAVAVSDRTRLQAVNVRVAALLVHVEVTLRMEADGEAAAPLAQDPERDLLRHRPARKQPGRLLAEEVRDARLEAFDALAAAVDVQPRPGPLRKRTERLGGIARRRRCGDEALAARDNSLAFP